AAGSVVSGVRHHRRWRAFLTLVLAVGVIVTGFLAAEGNFEVFLHVTGGVLLAATHLVNRHLCRTCPAPDCGPASHT
ncbi:MAG: MerC domain-containing protein, partial [Gemmatimonadota bacterium]|nr:MerC domain-containing protein [Gemmatimonadota bacterium]